MSKRHDKTGEAKAPSRGELTAQLMKLETDSANFVAQAKEQIAFFQGRMSLLREMLGIKAPAQPEPERSPPAGAQVMAPVSPKKLKQMLKNGAAKVAEQSPAQE